MTPPSFSLRKRVVDTISTGYASEKEFEKDYIDDKSMTWGVHAVRVDDERERNYLDECLVAIP